MYSTCLFCKSALGSNEVIEHFPVGRRLAFDAARGRLWVVCRACERWNLSPLEERWEAIEESERRFRGTTLRASTENIGLARLPEGLELVRIGEPLRPEFAAWRYGDQFGRRMKSYSLLMGGTTAAALTYTFGGPLLGVATGGIGMVSYLFIFSHLIYRRLYTGPATRIPLEGDTAIEVRLGDLKETVLRPAANPEGWLLRVRHRAGHQLLSGPDAVRAAGLLLPSINFAGSSRAGVQLAVAEIERVGHPARYFAEAARRLRVQTSYGLFHTPLTEAPHELRLALEMAAHEEVEREAIEGELRFLEQAWREAEEIAAIADQLGLPAKVEEFIRRHRQGAQENPEMEPPEGGRESRSE